MNISPNPYLPRLWCDFNAIGWSGQPDDDCYYIFDMAVFANGSITEGLCVFAFMYDNQEETEITGCEMTFEPYHDGWRLRSDVATWYSGPLPW